MQRVGELIGGVLPATAGGEALLPLLRAWPEAVGPAIAAETWPARVGRDGVVVVHVRSAVWASELTLLAGEVAAKVQAALGGPAPALRFVVGPVPEPPRRAARTPVPPAAAAAAAELVAAVADDELRSAMQAALARALVRSETTPDSA